MKPKTVGRADGQTQPVRTLYSESLETGFVPGTIVLTQDGEIPVEHIADGDRIITRDCGFVKVNQITHSRQRVRVISFAAGSLGHTRPESDLILPAAQLVLIRDWRAQAMFGETQALVRADALTDGEFVRDIGTRDMVLYQLHFDSEHIVYAGGLEAAGHGQALSLRPAA